MAEIGASAAAHTRLDDAVERLDEIIHSLRRFIFDLRPPVWARSDLRTVLTSLVAQMAAPHHVSVGVHVECSPDAISPTLADDVCGIAKEALSNALRHAGAEAITVRAVCTNNVVAMSVNDDGAGFDIGAQSAGMGLINMAERVAAAGGTFSVDSDAERGTTVTARFPIR